jgi:hypothetical protein
MHSILQGTYDSLSDVLYFSLGAPVASEAEGRDGIELAYAQADGRPCGAAVLGYKASGWDRNLDKLSSIIASHLAVGGDDTKNVVRSATKQLPITPRH